MSEKVSKEGRIRISEDHYYFASILDTDDYFGTDIPTWLSEILDKDLDLDNTTKHKYKVTIERID
jgi:hypothetical protein